MSRPIWGGARLRWAVGGAAAAAVLGAVGLAVATRLANAPGFQAYVAQTASRAVGRPITFRSLSVAVLPRPAVKLERLRVAEDPAFGPGPFLAVDEGRMRIRLRPLLSGRVELADLTLEAPVIELIEDGRGRWNWSSLGVAPAAPSAPRAGGPAGPGVAAVALSHISIVDGTMRYRPSARAAGGGPITARNINAELTPGGAGIRIRGEAMVEPGGVRVTLVDGAVSRAGGQALADMPVKATVRIDAADAGALAAVMSATPVMSGPLKGYLDVAGTVGHMVATGAFSMDRAAVSADVGACGARPRPLLLTDVRMPLAYAAARVNSSPAEARVAGGAVSAAIAVDLGSDRAAMAKDIAIRGVEVAPLLVEFLCHPFAVTGPLDLTGDARLRLGDPPWAVAGSGRFRVGPGTVVGSEVAKLLQQALRVSGVISTVVGSASGAGAPLAFDSITGTYTIADGLVRSRDLRYRSADVTVTGAGTYALRDGRVDMQVVLTQGPNEIRGVVTGSAGALHVAPTGVKIPDVRGIKRFVQTLLR